MPKVYASGSNTYVPSPEATNNMRVEFTRNPNKFALPLWVEYRPVTRDVGYYIAIEDEEMARLVSSTLDDMAWPDANDAPSGNENKTAFEFLEYRTKRRAIPYNIGYKASQQATWNILAMYARVYAQRAMTARTQLAVALAQLAANWGANTGDVDTNITGNTGRWDVSTEARGDIQRSIHWAVEKIILATNAAVDPTELLLVVSPGCARKIAASNEFKSWLVRSPFAMEQVKGKTGRNAAFGLPENLFGTDVLVERTVKVTNRKGAARAAVYVMADDKPFIVKRPGAIEMEGEGPTFSPITMFLYEDMTVEGMDDPNHRRTSARLVDDYDVKMTAAAAGFLFTDAVS